jgi:hypothetical protein
MYDFPVIRDFILANPNVQLDPSLVRIYREQGVVEIYGINPDNALSAYRVSKKLQDKGYMHIPDLNSILESLTGMTLGKAYEVFSEEKRSKPRTAKVTRGAIQKNLLGSPKIASRIRTKFGMGNDQIDDNMFSQVVHAMYQGNYKTDADGNPIGPWGPENWVGPFGPSTSPDQQEAQIKGVQFIGSRKASILADEPGSGKTMQAIVGADMVREDGQKTLVITPNGLLAENWTGADAKGPMYFCGHDRKSIAVIGSADDVYAAAMDPEIKWVILKESTVRLDDPEVTKLMQAIKLALTCYNRKKPNIKQDKSNMKRGM